MHLPEGHQHRSLDAQSLQLAVDLDHTAVAGAVAARHRCLPRELRARAERRDGLEHRLRAAGEDVAGRIDQLRDEHGSMQTSAPGRSAAASACAAVRNPSTAGAPGSDSAR